MKKIRYIYFAVLTFVLCWTTSCKKLVEVSAPNNTLSTATVFDNDQTAIAAQLAGYTYIEQSLSLFQIEVNTALSSDELTNYFTDQPHIDLYRNNLNAQDATATSLWSGCYNLIYQENAIIENVQASKGMSSRVKQLATGEALFTRAWCYFELVNLYGDVPLELTTDYIKNSTLARTPTATIYTQIIADLQSAQTMLSTSYLDANDNPGATDKIRPTTWAADALLARVYLYLGKYALSDAQASLVLGNGVYALSPLTGSTEVFAKNSAESIWQLMPVGTNLYTQEGINFVWYGPVGSGASSNVSLSPQLLNAFEANDLRKSNWVGSYTQGSTTWYFPFKYKQGFTNTSTLNEYSVVLRLGEQYLIRAEDEVFEGKTTNALADLNAIRTRAGLSNYSGATDQASLLNAIAHERQVELFTENDRWFNLKRTNTIDAIMGSAAPQKNGIWNTYQQLYPLKTTDLQLNPNLTQNPGY